MGYDPHRGKNNTNALPWDSYIKIIFIRFFNKKKL